MDHEAPVVVLGAGLTGLAAASELRSAAIVLEAEASPGGLVRTECFDGFWFDRVIHLLYFADEDTRGRIVRLLGSNLSLCRPRAFVVTAAGTVRYPFQTHLGDLDARTADACVRDFVAAAEANWPSPATTYYDMLERTFGKKMCEVFFFPYNRKMWRRPLTSLAPTGFHWNISRPSLASLLRGVEAPDEDSGAYNAEGYYPRPPKDAPQRGMQVLADALACEVRKIHLGHRVQAILPNERRILARHGSDLAEFSYQDSCLSTIPLTTTMSICVDVPRDLATAVAGLRANRVRSVALSIVGPRPRNCGHWRYYADPSVSFIRLIFLHEFDPHCAPEHGWCLLAEVTEPQEAPETPAAEIIERVKADVEKQGVLADGCRVVDAHVMVAAPAYVVFTPHHKKVLDAARAFLRERHIMPLGRYGNWEYSSMAQNLRDGFAWGAAARERLNASPF